MVDRPDACATESPRHRAPRSMEGRRSQGDSTSTQNDKLMAALMQGQTLTPLLALQIAGTLRLSERVRELSAEGVPIEKERVRVGGKNVMSYKLWGLAYG